jgi:hypothetical protein
LAHVFVRLVHTLATPTLKRRAKAIASARSRGAWATVASWWEQSKNICADTTLGVRANLNERTIGDFEKGRRVPSANNLAAIRRALESAGVEFIAENGGAR